MKLYLIRHGQTDWNIQGKIQGCHDIPLNGTGRAQAALVAAAMDDRPVTRIFSSTLKRAVETAGMIGERQKTPVCLVSGLAEVKFGRWEGMTWAEIKEEYPAEFGRWTLNPAGAAPLGGETRDAVMKRVAAAVGTVMAITDGHGDIAVVSHGATIAYMAAYLMGKRPGELEITVENAAITTVSYNSVTQDYMLLKVNDTSHLKGR